MLEGAAGKYRQALESIPAPGDGCHPYLLTVANLGVLSGKDPDQIFSDVRARIPAGRRSEKI